LDNILDLVEQAAKIGNINQTRLDGLAINFRYQYPKLSFRFCTFLQIVGARITGSHKQQKAGTSFLLFILTMVLQNQGVVKAAVCTLILRSSIMKVSVFPQSCHFDKV